MPACGRHQVVVLGRCYWRAPAVRQEAAATGSSVADGNHRPSPQAKIGGRSRRSVRKMVEARGVSV